jgi:hypothetical protein
LAYHCATKKTESPTNKQMESRAEELSLPGNSGPLLVNAKKRAAKSGTWPLKKVRSLMSSSSAGNLQDHLRTAIQLDIAAG